MCRNFLKLSQSFPKILFAEPFVAYCILFFIPKCIYLRRSSSLDISCRVKRSSCKGPKYNERKKSANFVHILKYKIVASFLRRCRKCTSQHNGRKSNDLSAISSRLAQLGNTSSRTTRSRCLNSKFPCKCCKEQINLEEYSNSHGLFNSKGASYEQAVKADNIDKKVRRPANNQ